MITSLKYGLGLLFCLAMSSLFAQSHFKPEDTEHYSPKPPIVTVNNGIPSDAIILFNGQNLDKWESSTSPTESANWTIGSGILTVRPGSGNIQTKDKFEDFQLHIEWQSPLVVKDEGQGRGNSGIFLQGLYELQVLDNQDNPTYVNGQAGSLYKQRPPLVESRVAPQAWHTYDILYTAPRFNKDNMLISKARVTVLHNGIVVQLNTEIEGTTEYIGLPQLKTHGPGSIILQDHGDLVNYRNIWIRRL
jgi:hypothetical protein